MKQFFVSYYGNFSNAYSLCYAETPEDFDNIPDNAERIARRDAIRLCAEENNRRKNDASFAYFGDNTILPAAYDGDHYNKLVKRGYIWERI